MFERKVEQDILRWHQKSPRKPLIIRGARQVGKSTLVRNFAASEHITLREVNLERHRTLDTVFKGLDLGCIIAELEAIFEAKIDLDHDILFLDEIQATPFAIQALRYFYEELPQLAVVAAGSLLEFVLSDHSFSMPVGRIEYLHLHPMSFEEFLQAMQHDYLLAQINNFQLAHNMADKVHEKLIERYRLYILLGGMPEALKCYFETKDFTAVRQVHHTLLETYIDDFSKYARQSQLALLQRLFRQVPNLVGKKVKYSNIDPHIKAREIRATIELLSNARVLSKVYHSNCSGMPISAGIDEKIYKLLFLDVGLMNAISGMKIQDLMDGELISQGVIAEQYIGQHLQLMHNTSLFPLCYWLREGRGNNAEVDYVSSVGQNIIPIEVKSGKTGTLKSLLQFVYATSQPLAVRFDLNQASLLSVVNKISRPGRDKNAIADEAHSYKLLSLPFYLVEKISLLINVSLLSTP